MTITAEDFKVLAVGEVLPPPTIAELSARLAEAAASKQPVTLTAGEVRILTDTLGA